MFEQTFVSGKTQTVRTTIISFIVQCLLIGVAILIPLIYTEVLPSTELTSFLVAPPPPPPPPPPPAAAPVEVVKVAPRQFNAGQLMAPKSVPKNIAIIKEEELPPPAAAQVGVVGGLGSSFGSLSGILGGVPEAAPPPPSLPRRLSSGSRWVARCSRPCWSASPSRLILRWPGAPAFRARFASTQ